MIYTETRDSLLLSTDPELLDVSVIHRFIAEGIEPGISGRNNLQTLAVCEMLVRSARDRRPVERAELG